MPERPERFSVKTRYGWVTEMQVCQSNAGYYIGRMAWDEENGFEEPGSRESGYYRTREEAEKALHEGFEVRDCFENNSSYANGGLPDTRPTPTDWEA